MQLNTITELLNIPNFKVTSIVSLKEDCINLVLEQIEDTIPICSGCGKAHKGIHSYDMVKVEDLPISGKRVFLYVSKRKVSCLEDSRIHTEELRWIRNRYTKRFAEHVYRLTSITANKEAGWFLGLDDEAVYRIDRGMLEELAKEKLKPIPCPRNISVDEVAWQKWHKYVTNVVDIGKKKVIWNHEGRGKGTLDRFYHELGSDGCKGVEGVACDGARGYIDSTKEHLKGALIALDHFHVKHYLNDALDTVRKEELKNAKSEGNGELAELLHCNQRFIMMRNKDTQRKKDLLERLSFLNERIYKAMLLKEQFLTIYAAGNRKEASINLRKWIITAIKSKIKSFMELAYKFFRKRHYILNYFISKITNAISEGINNKIKRLKRMAYGYRDVTYFLLKIHQHCGLLNPKIPT